VIGLTDHLGLLLLVPPTQQDCPKLQHAVEICSCGPHGGQAEIYVDLLRNTCMPLYPSLKHTPKLRGPVAVCWLSHPSSSGMQLQPGHHTMVWATQLLTNAVLLLLLSSSASRLQAAPTTANQCCKYMPLGKSSVEAGAAVCSAPPDTTPATGSPTTSDFH
jgi:hypothetical protein